MKNSKILKTTLALTAAIFLLVAFTKQDKESQPINKENLVFVASFPNYNNWLENAFTPDTERRAQFCNEAETKAGKIDENSSIVYISDFDMTRMPEFAGDPKMIALMKENKIEHNEVYLAKPLTEDFKITSPKVNLHFYITTNSYKNWLEKAFTPDAERRAQFCDEKKTKVSKVSDTEAMVILYNFEVDKLFEFGENAEIEKLMKKYNVTHRISVLESLE